MKTIISLVLMAVLPLFVEAQDFIDNMIDKYQGKEGFTTVVINKELFDIVAAIDDDKDLNKLKDMVDNIRIIAMEDELNSSDINFFKEIKNQININDYKELMTVKEHDNDVVFYVKYAGKTIEELLLIAGGHDDNAIISIKGRINTKQLASMSKSVNISGFKYLSKLDEN